MSEMAFPYIKPIYPLSPLQLLHHYLVCLTKMNTFTSIISVCFLAVAVRARPGVGHHGLHGVPDLQTFSEIKYPHNELIHLGEYSKGYLPGDTIHETKHITIPKPEPYPVKIEVPHPYPVPVAKPYPVVKTKYVKVPYAVPYEISKPVPVPVEEPKRYTMPVYHDSHGDGSSYDHGSAGSVEHSSSFETDEYSSEGHD